MGRVRVRAWGDFPAETLRRREVGCVFISRRLCVAAGFGFRYCVVELLCYRGAGATIEGGAVGRDRVRACGDFPQRR